MPSPNSDYHSLHSFCRQRLFLYSSGHKKHLGTMARRLLNNMGGGGGAGGWGASNNYLEWYFINIAQVDLSLRTEGI